MTDICKSNNYYYTATQYNATSQPVFASIDENLVFPLLDVSSDYQVAVSKARVDLSTIPLTRSNFPLKKYQVGIRSGTTEQTAYVRQVNSTNSNYVYNVSTAGVVTYNKYSTSGVITQQGSFDVSQYLKSIGSFVVDVYNNYYIAGSASLNATTYNLLYVFAENGTVITTETLTSIKCLAFNSAQQLFIGDDGSTNVVYVYDVVNGEGVATLTLNDAIRNDFNDNPLGSIQTVCAGSIIVVGTDANTITLYNSTTFQPYSTFNQTDITQLSNFSAILSEFDRYVLCDEGNVPNLFFGLSVASPTELVNMLSETQFVTGNWTGKSALTNDFGYAISNDNNQELYSFPYNSTSGVCGIPSLYYSSGITNQNVVSYPNSNAIVLQGGNNLYFNDAGIDNTFVSFSDFNIQTTPSVISVGQFDYQNSTGLIVAVGSNNNLYTTSQAILPRMFLTFPPTLGDGTTEIKQYGVGSLSGDLASSTLLPINMTGGFGNYVWNGFAGAYKTPSKFISLRTGLSPSPTSAITNQIIQYSLPTYAYLTESLLSGNGVDDAFCSAISHGTLTDGAFYLLLQVYNNNTTIFVYNEATDAYITKFSLPVPASSPLPTMSCFYNGSLNYLFVSSANAFWIYSITGTIAGGIVITNIADEFSIDYPDISQFIFGSAFLLNEGGLPSIYCITNGSAEYPATNRALLKLNFTGTYATQNLSTVIQDGISASGYISSNDAFQEIYVPSGDKSKVVVFNAVSESETGLITLDTTPNGVIYSCADITNTYSWVSTIMGGASITPASIAISKVNPNDVFLTSTTGGVYSGVITDTPSIDNIAAYSAIGATYNVINTYLPPSVQYNGKIFAYGLSTGQTLHNTYETSGKQVLGICSNDVSGEFLVSTTAVSGNLVSLPPTNSNTPTTWTPTWTNTLTNANVIFAANGANIDAGSFDIYSFSVLINAINAAFKEAYNKFPSGTFTEPPSVTLSPSTGLLTLNYSPDYAVVPATSGILLNNALLQLCYFPSTVDTLDNTLNLISLIAGSTSLTQTSKSIYLFNQLDKIILITDTIYVAGSFFGNNNVNNIIQTIDIPTSSAGYFENLGQVLYFQPTFLRPFILASNNALQRIQLTVNYVYLDETEHRLLIAPNNNFNATLLFPRRF